MSLSPSAHLPQCPAPFSPQISIAWQNEMVKTSRPSEQLSLYRVTSLEVGMTLRFFLHRRLPHLSHRALQKRVDRGHVTVNKRLVRSGQAPLIEGDLIEVKVTSEAASDHEFNWSNRLIWNHENFCAIDKPTDIESEKIANLIGQPTWRLVHRLDKGTSGVLLLAKNITAAKLGWDLFRKKRAIKHYLALVCGRAPRQATVRAGLCPGLKLEGKTVWEISKRAADRPNGDRALSAMTHFERLDFATNASLIFCRPVTGRTHQIRLHAAHMGHAVVGDREYNPSTLLCPSRLMLHASRLKIPELDLDVTAALPKDINSALAQLKLNYDPDLLDDLKDCYGALPHQ